MKKKISVKTTTIETPTQPSPEDTRQQLENQLINKIRTGARIFTQEEYIMVNEIYQRVGKEGDMCFTCPSSISRAFEVILAHYK